MSNYSGDRKREILDRKKNQEKEFKVVVTNWVDGILNKTETFFDEYEEAKLFSDKQKGQIKIYGFNNQLIFSGYNEHPQPPKFNNDNLGMGHYNNDHHGHHGHHGHHDDDDDSYS